KRRETPGVRGHRRVPRQSRRLRRPRGRPALCGAHRRERKQRDRTPDRGNPRSFARREDEAEGPSDRAPPEDAPVTTASGVAERLLSLRARITSAARRVGRDPGKITLIGVTKRVDATRVAEAVSLGLRDLGENYVQEARQKIHAVREILAPGKTPQALRWHGIGQLQRNKVREAVALFDVIHSVDRIALARELDQRAGQVGRRIEVFLQVNLSGETQKGGVPPSLLGELAAECAKLPHLVPLGLMALPAESRDPE